jgi:hypothetical protein
VVSFDAKILDRYIGECYNKDEVEVLKRELTKLTVNEYIETVNDARFLNKSEIRVELVSIAHANGNNFIFVMSFHFLKMDFNESDFPYRQS